MRIGVAFFFFLAMFVVGVLLLKFSATSNVPAEDRLVVISPHWEGIQYEFERAFKEHIRETEDNREIDIEWFDVGGGTSTIKRYLEQEYQKYMGRKNSKGGVGIDVLFGGGTELYLEFSKPRPGPDGKIGGPPILASYRPPPELLDQIPETLTPSRAPGGIRIYDRNGRWYGAALSAFGIVYNKRIVEQARLLTPEDWEDLAAPRAFGWVASGDPSTSGSVHLMYELILQSYGFERGYALICRMGGNVAAFDEGGASAPRAVGIGQMAYGMCIDFYGQAEVAHVGAGLLFTVPWVDFQDDVKWGVLSQELRDEFKKHKIDIPESVMIETKNEGKKWRITAEDETYIVKKKDETLNIYGADDVAFILPRGLTVITADPIAILQGASNQELAEKFVDFVLSREGQKLWFLKRGEDGGPETFELNRLSVRRDLYEDYLETDSTNITYNPYDYAEQTRGKRPYNSKLAGRRWDVINALFLSTIIYPHDELKAAWSALIAAGRPEDIMDDFSACPVSETNLDYWVGTREKPGKWANERFRALKMDGWEAWAREKYRRVSDQCRERLHVRSK